MAFLFVGGFHGQTQFYVRSKYIMPTLPEIPIPNLTDSQKLYTKMIENLVSVNTAVNDLQADVKTLNTVVIVGNGELPLREVVRNHEKFILDIKDTMKYWGRLVGGALLLNFIGFMIGIVLAIYRFLPILEKLAQKP